MKYLTTSEVALLWETTKTYVRAEARKGRFGRRKSRLPNSIKHGRDWLHSPKDITMEKMNDMKTVMVPDPKYIEPVAGKLVAEGLTAETYTQHAAVKALQATVNPRFCLEVLGHYETRVIEAMRELEA